MHPARATLLVGWTATVLSLGGLGCNVVDAVLRPPVEIVKMVPGGNVATGGLDCWVTLEFHHYPETADLTDVSIRFTSTALSAPAEFDWSYIATHDVVPSGSAFGSGHTQATQSKPDELPPLGEPLKVRFALDARERIEHAPSTLRLKAQVFWGERAPVAEAERTIEHVYSRSGNDYF